MRILFITHDTARTGAPIVLLNFLKWIKEQRPKTHLDLLTLSLGDLSDEFIAVCENFYYYDAAVLNSHSLTFKERIIRKLKILNVTSRESFFLDQIANNNYNIIYANTVSSLYISTKILKRSSKCKLILHVHELSVIIEQILPNFSDFDNLVDKYIAPSKLVKTALITRWQIPSEKIDIIYECSEYVVEENDKISKTNEFVIGGSGTVHWRKGFDLFLQVVKKLNIQPAYQHFKFLWVGYIPELEEAIIKEDIRKLEIENVIQFTGEIEKPHEVYKNFDVFLMTSREDPFPLVCIEVGMLGKPIISFNNATGINEIIKDEGGFVVPYLNVDEMVEKIKLYDKNPTIRENHGQFNAKEFSRFTPEKMSPLYFKKIEELSNISPDL